MCGIVGVVGGAVDARRAALDRAVIALGHRGPDGSRTMHGEFADLGHTRLAVLDPTSAADQPMTDHDTGCVLVYNGEVYNFVELRADLEALGHRFKSTGDTEVVLKAYLEWGDACLDRLNGMFAMAIADPRRGGVFLARDRFGEKPLHLHASKESVWFASEIKALFAAGVLKATACDRYLHRFLATGDIGHPDETAFEGVIQLPAGHAATIGKGGSVHRWRWWSVPAPSSGATPDDLDSMLRDSVSIRLRSDVPVGTSLSGGVDSTLIMDLVRSIRPDGEVHAFTASFPNSDLDELPAAEQTAKALGVVLHPVALDHDDLVNDLGPLHRVHESPVESPSVLAQFAVMREAANAGITVLLDGQGADETWGGYPKYARMALMDDLAQGRPVRAVRRARTWRNVNGTRLRIDPSRYLVLLGGPRARKAIETGMGLAPRWMAAEYRHHTLGTDPIGGIPLPAAHVGHVSSDATARDLDRVTLPRLLHYADRNSMAFSREVRLPYLDHRLVELAMAVPMERKLVGGWTKEPLRDLLEERGYGQIARKPGKLAYTPPTEKWLEHPSLSERVADSWADLARARIVSTSRPIPSVLPRWRVLSLATWAESFGVRLN